MSSSVACYFELRLSAGVCVAVVAWGYVLVCYLWKLLRYRRCFVWVSVCLMMLFVLLWL